MWERMEIISICIGSMLPWRMVFYFNKKEKEKRNDICNPGSKCGEDVLRDNI